MQDCLFRVACPLNLDDLRNLVRVARAGRARVAHEAHYKEYITSVDKELGNPLLPMRTFFEWASAKFPN